MTSAALPGDKRPTNDTPVHTDDLPDTPIRTYNIPASAWIEAPPELLALGDGIDAPVIAYKRRLQRWLLWRAGPATGAHARYMAVNADDVHRQFIFRLDPEGIGDGTGPSGAHHERLRTWKQDLNEHA